MVAAKALWTKTNVPRENLSMFKHMNELVGLVSQVVVQLMETSPPLVSAAAEGEKTKHPVNATVAPTQGEPPSSGTSDDPNSLAMVVQSDVEPIEEPPTKKFKLFGSGPSQFTPTPPINMANKGKGIAQSTDKSTLKMIMLLMEQGSDLKAAKDKSEEALKRLTPAQRKAQKQKLTEIETKRAQKLNKSREEYLNCIELRDNQQKITKFEYQVNNSTKIATMNITRNNPPLNYKIHDDFRKRANKIRKEVFVSEDVVVDGMHRNLTPPLEITFGKSDQVLENPEAGILYFNGNWDLVFQRAIESKPHVVAAREIVEKNLAGLGFDKPF
nr:hypothetical protein [Tanacetum cinerariifolium]